MRAFVRAAAAAASGRRNPFAGQLRWLLSLSRSSSAASADADADALQKEVLIEGKASARAAVLNRPEFLNALTTNMGRTLKKLYESWEDNPDVGFVLMKGSGKAFCAGGDVVALYRLINEGKLEECMDFFRELYSFIYVLGTYLKPHVAILDGYTMGGGGGVSIPGTFRVSTNKTIFSTPEVQIGFHPDAGASFYLSRLTGYLGEYLALTGDRLNGVDMLAAGLATHYIDHEKLSLLDNRLSTIVTDDPSVVDSSIALHGDVVYPDERSIVHRLEIINKCFAFDTVEEIVDALEVEAARSNLDWCSHVLKKLRAASPLSLKVSLRSIREGRFQTLDECIIREYRMSLNGISDKQYSHEFCEGVRARLVDKDFSPKWDSPNLKAVSEDMVDGYFAPLDEFEELKLPTDTREAFV